MSNILIITAVFDPEPIVSAKLSKALAESLCIDHNVTVLSPKPSRPFGFKFEEKVLDCNKSFKHIILDSYICPQSSLIGRFTESYSFGKYCEDFINIHAGMIDVIYLNSWPLASQFLIVRVANKYCIPVITHIQDIYPESLSTKIGALSYFVNKALIPLDKYILNRSTHVIAISERMKSYLAQTRNIESSNLSVALNWQEHQDFLDVISGHNDDKFTLMYLGNIGPVAGVQLLIDSFVDANIPNSRLVIAGSGSMKTLLENYAKKYIDYDIQFWSVPEGKVADVQAKADVLLLPIKKGAASSSIPSKLPAYMFSAKPVLVSADLDSDTVKVVSKAECGICVNPESIKELSVAMITLSSSNIKLLREFGLNGRQFALKYFSKEKNIAIICNVINKILDDKHS